MNSITIYEVLKPTTTAGYSVKISTIYSSHNKEEIDQLVKACREEIGSGLVTNYEVNENETRIDTLG